jgi:hypothetical protein
MYISILYAAGYLPARARFRLAHTFNGKTWSGLRHDVINSATSGTLLVLYNGFYGVFGTNGDVLRQEGI